MGPSNEMCHQLKPKKAKTMLNYHSKRHFAGCTYIASKAERFSLNVGVLCRWLAFKRRLVTVIIAALHCGQDLLLIYQVELKHILKFEF